MIRTCCSDHQKRTCSDHFDQNMLLKTTYSDHFDQNILFFDDLIIIFDVHNIINDVQNTKLGDHPEGDPLNQSPSGCDMVDKYGAVHHFVTLCP